MPQTQFCKGISTHLTLEQFETFVLPHLHIGSRGHQPKLSLHKIFNTIERVFAWEDKFKRLLLRFERISGLHYALKNLAYTRINLRHFAKVSIDLKSHSFRGLQDRDLVFYAEKTEL